MTIVLGYLFWIINKIKKENRMKKVIPLVLLALAGCFSPKLMKVGYSTCMLPEQKPVSCVADRMIVNPDTREVELLGNVRLIVNETEMESDAIRFKVKRGKCRTLPVDIDITHIEGSGKEKLPVTWEADQMVMHANSRMIYLIGNVTIVEGNATIKTDSLRIYLK